MGGLLPTVPGVEIPIPQPAEEEFGEQGDRYSSWYPVQHPFQLLTTLAVEVSAERQEPANDTPGIMPIG